MAPPLDRTVATDFAEAVKFLYTGEKPIQVGVAAGTFDPRTVAVVRGCLTDERGAPLAGVQVSVRGRPAFGRTATGPDGLFNLVVNGGGQLVVDFQHPERLPAQRTVSVTWRDYTTVEEVVLLKRDSQVTRIDLTANVPMQVARGSVSQDDSGRRQATVLIPQGTQAGIVQADGTTTPTSNLSIRATEYTVGPDGPAAMPGTLPPQSGYTYAIELATDEALSQGTKVAGRDVVFSQPVWYYVENFLNFPVGTPVPTGYYDPDKGAWVASDNGQIVKVIAIANGRAELDTDGDGRADNNAALGITDAERERLATLYQAGQSLWRVPLTHFSIWDCNWPFGPGPDDTPYQGADPEQQIHEEDSNKKCGSIIDCQNQTLGEVIPISGTPFTLHYRSDRMPGRLSAATLGIPLSTASPPARLKRIELEVQVAGQRITQTFPAGPNQRADVVWNGQDAYGRLVQGQQPALVRIGYVYDGVYQQPGSGRRSFGAPSGVPITGSRTRQEVTLWNTWEGTLGRWETSAQGIGGWSLSAHHVYDPGGQVLYTGDGQQRSLQSIQAIIQTVAGTGRTSFAGEGQPAALASFVPTDPAFGPDGSLYLADNFNSRILRINPAGVLTTVAGTGRAGFSGDGGPAAQAQVNGPVQIEVAADGVIYFADTGNNRVRRIGLDGVITTVAGTGQAGFSGDGGPATDAQVGDDTAPLPDRSGGLYIADMRNHRIRYIGPDGRITTVAGTGSAGFSGDGGPAIQARFNTPTDLALDRDGNLYLGDAGNSRIRRIDPAGIVTTVVGGGANPFVEGGKGTDVQINLAGGTDIAVAADGSLYFTANRRATVLQLSTDGTVTTVVGGSGSSGFSGDGGPALAGRINGASGLVVGVTGDLYIADTSNGRVRRITPPLPTFSTTDIAIPSEDGSEIYQFSAQGRHLKTIHAATGATLLTFGYDGAGRLVTMTDGDGNVTTIERTADGTPAAIVAPFGQRTTLTVNAAGYLGAIANPAGEQQSFTYTANGLLTSMTDARGSSTRYAYGSDGRLVSATDRVGNTKTLTRTLQGGTYQVPFADALGRTTTYQVERLPGGSRVLANTLPDGTRSIRRIGADGSEQLRMPNGMGSSTVERADPRFGMLAPVLASQVLTTPAGLKLETATERAVVLGASDHPLNLTSETENTTINGRRYSSVYNAATRTFSLSTPVGRDSSTTIDAQGRVISETVDGLAPVVYAYDARGRLTTMTQGSGAEARTVSISYNAQSYVEQISDPLGRATRFAYDAVGRVTVQTLPDGREIRYAYDANGNLTALTPPGRPAHTFTYTPDDLTATYVAPDAGAGSAQTAYSYNAARQLTEITRADGQSLAFTYDAAGRLSTLTTPRGPASYSYNATTGNLEGISAPGEVGLAYTYDGGLLLNETWSGPVAGAVGRIYDNNFRITATSVNGGSSIALQYDNDGLLTRAGNLTLTRSAVNGLLTGASLGSTNDTWTYNAFAEPLSHRARTGSTVLYNVAYTRDALGRITQKAETIGGVTTTYAYSYDQAGRLIEVRQDGALVEQYTYDLNGNRLSAIVRGVTANGSYDNQDRLLSYGGSSYNYNAHGDLVSKTTGGQTTTYQYDVQGNLVGVTLPNGTAIGYIVDGQNRRIGKTVNGTLVQGWLYEDGLRPIAELDGTGAIVSRFVYAGRANVPEYLIKGNVTYRIVHDQLGSPRLVVNTATGAIAQRLDYDAFGNVLQDTAPGFQSFGFAGGLYDRDTGLVRFGARDYDAQVGRWTAKDPIGFVDSANLYNYASNDPVNFADPIGQNALAAARIGGQVGAFAGPWGALAGALVGAAVGLAIGNVVFNEAADQSKEGTQPEQSTQGNQCPIPGAKPVRETKGRTKIYEKPGGLDEANKDFDNLGPSDVADRGNGIRTGTLPDGRRINVRPDSSDGRPTIEVQSGSGRIKVRYGK